MHYAIDDLPIEIQQGDLITRYVEWHDMAVRYVRVPAGTDFGPVLAGLPDDRCPSPHWGLVLEGSIHLRHADGTEDVTSAGEVYHWPAGHTGWTDEGTAFIEIGPVAPMRAFGDHVKKLLGG
jgi:hypothetical protein